MSQTMEFLDCWIGVATSLFEQALVGEPKLTDALPKPLSAGSFGFAVEVAGEAEGRFAVMLDGGLAEAALLGEGADQRAGWEELARETFDAAAGDLLARSGVKVTVTGFAAIEGEARMTRAFQLRAGDRSWPVLVFSEVKPRAAGATAAEKDAAKAAVGKAPNGKAVGGAAATFAAGQNPAAGPAPAVGEGKRAAASRTATDEALTRGLSPGLSLLLDVELEASLRFGAREMPLSEILDLGPGDVVQLDRHVADPVDLIVGDKIVARGEVVLVNGNFGLRVTEVAEPQRRLESIRCLF